MHVPLILLNYFFIYLFSFLTMLSRHFDITLDVLEIDIKTVFYVKVFYTFLLILELLFLILFIYSVMLYRMILILFCLIYSLFVLPSKYLMPWSDILFFNRYLKKVLHTFFILIAMLLFWNVLNLGFYKYIILFFVINYSLYKSYIKKVSNVSITSITSLIYTVHSMYKNKANNLLSEFLNHLDDLNEMRTDTIIAYRIIDVNNILKKKTICIYNKYKLKIFNNKKRFYGNNTGKIINFKDSLGQLFLKTGKSLISKNNSKLDYTNVTKLQSVTRAYFDQHKLTPFDGKTNYGKHLSDIKTYINNNGIDSSKLFSNNKVNIKLFKDLDNFHLDKKTGLLYFKAYCSKNEFISFVVDANNKYFIYNNQLFHLDIDIANNIVRHFILRESLISYEKTVLFGKFSDFSYFYNAFDHSSIGMNGHPIYTRNI